MSKGVVYTEEHIAGIEPRFKKVVWFDENTILKSVDASIFKSSNPTLYDMRSLKESLKTMLKNDKYKFNGETFFRYKTNRLGRVVEFGITYVGID